MSTDDRTQEMPAALPEAQAEVIPAAEEEHPPTLASIPVIRPDQIQCTSCGELYAFGTEAASPHMVAAMEPAAEEAGWKRDGEAWTCNVCVAKANAPAPAPEPEPEPHEPAPDTDPYEQYLAWEEEERGIPRPEPGTTGSNNRTLHKISLRNADAMDAIGRLLHAATPLPPQQAEEKALGLLSDLGGLEAGFPARLAEIQLWVAQRAAETRGERQEAAA